MSKRGTFTVFVTVIAIGALTACSSDSTVRAAEAQVSAKERALADAQSAATAAAAEFCSASSSYIVALDRYGDVLHKTAPTVGDVTDAGKDLKAPRQDATAAAEDAVAAQQQVVTTEQELAAAQASLASLTATATTTASATSASGSPTPSSTPAPNEAVTRVQQAEDDFATAQRGITPSTPLTQAAQQFNAAAVALEMSWIQLYAEAGCVTGDQEKTQAAIHDYTAALQQALTDAGYYTGAIDGIYGPSTQAAVEALQKAHGLPVTGWVDKATEAALQSDLTAKGGAAAQSAVATTAAVQQTLKLAGYWDGPVDGQWTPALTDALKKFQTDLGVPATGTVDAATIAAVEAAVAPKPSPSPTPTAPSASPASTSPTSAAPSPTSS